MKAGHRTAAPWWMYFVAAVYLLTFLLNARQEIWGPSNSGFILALPEIKVARVIPHTPADLAGLKSGDVIEAADRMPVTGLPDWFLVRANIELNRPVELQVRRGNQKLLLPLVITTRSWHTWPGVRFIAASSFYTARFSLLLLAIYIVFSRPRQLSAFFLAFIFATSAVAEGNPTPGWAAMLRHLSPVVAIPVCLATASWLLIAVPWLMFFAVFPRPRLNRQWRWGLGLLPLIVFTPPLVTSAVAMIYSPASLSQWWPGLLSSTSIRFIQQVADAAPLLFLNRWPFYRPLALVHLWELWLALTVAYLFAGFFIAVWNYRAAQGGDERRQLRELLIAPLILLLAVVHNAFTRNWTTWSAKAAPPIVSAWTFWVDAALFLIACIILTRAALSQRTPGERAAGAIASLR